MLKIKESRWQEFCEKAEELGFNKTSEWFYKVKCNTSTLRVTVDTKKIDLYGDMCMGEKATEKLYDLISQGFVEKVEK